MTEPTTPAQIELKAELERVGKILEQKAFEYCIYATSDTDFMSGQASMSAEHLFSVVNAIMDRPEVRAYCAQVIADRMASKG